VHDRDASADDVEHEDGEGVGEVVAVNQVRAELVNGVPEITLEPVS
jgi:hypothetical protein